MERLQKILSARGVASRRAAEEWIKAGRVSVNGRTAALGDTADPEKDDIRVDGKQLPRQEKLLYLMLHKPRGYVTTLHDEKGRPDAARLVAEHGSIPSGGWIWILRACCSSPTTAPLQTC